MTSSFAQKLKWRLFLLILLVGLEELAIIELSNVFLNGIPWSYELSNALPFIAMILVVTVASYYLYTLIKLREVFRLTSERMRELPNEEKTRLFRKVVLFPQHFFRFSVIFLCLTSVAWHLYDYYILGNHWDFIYLIQPFLQEQTIGLVSTMTIYSFLHILLRPLILQFEQYRLIERKRLTHIAKIFIVVLTVFVLTTSVLINLYITWMLVGSSLTVMKVAIVLAILLAHTLLFIRFSLLYPFQSINDVAGQLKSLEQEDRNQIHAKLPIPSLDEVGGLIDAFNRMQAKVQTVYREIDEELKLAYNVQKHLLAEKQLSFPDLRLEAVSVPAFDVGGDFYDVIAVDDNKVGILIGDVSGKGLPAALIASVVIGLVRGRSHTKDITPSRLLTEINRLLLPLLSEDMYASAGFGFLDMEQRAFTYASAGHVSPIVKAKGELVYLQQSSLPLGIDSDIDIRDEIIALDDAEEIFLYTDGVVEQFNGEEEMYGFGRLEQLLSRPERSSAREVLDSVLLFAGMQKKTDDMTLIRLSRL